MVDAMKKAQKKVFMAMSGGVDSTVAAALLKQRGYDVIGAHMKCYNLDGCAERDAEDARRAAEQLHIPLYVFDFEQEYKNKVVGYMINGYKQGITPNPDVMCNKEIKFGLFLNRALELGADYIATGHYVRLLKTEHYTLKIAADKNKDQSYFLWTLTQHQLKHCLFPIGDYTKPRVRNMARTLNLLTADKKDSQGICFLGNITLANFLSQYIPAKQGAVLSAAGKKIGDHNGAQFYTIGQRHGLALGGRKEPLYIADKNIAENTITVTEKSARSTLYKKEIMLTDINFIDPSLFPNPYIPTPLLVRVRYRQPLAKATLHKLKADSYKLIFNNPQCIAPGQSAVFYNTRKEMLGGGIIA